MHPFYALLRQSRQTPNEFSADIYSLKVVIKTSVQKYTAVQKSITAANSKKKHVWPYYHIVFTRHSPDAYSELNRTSKMELFAKIVNG